MLKLGKLADYATALMTALAAQPDRVRTTPELAETAHVAAPTAAKLLKVLARSGLIESQRGAHGGYKLCRDPQKITVADIIKAVEGPIAVTECSTQGGGCSIESSCNTRANWRLINGAIRQALEAITLAQMAAPLRRIESPIQFHRTTQAAGH